MPGTATIPSGVAFRYALAALENARSLRASAGRLFEENHFGLASSLAISALEELGKFFRALYISLELTSTEVGSQALRNHSKKQASGALLSEVTKFASLDGLHVDLSSAAASSPSELLAHINDQMLAQVDSIAIDQSAVPALEAAIREAASGEFEARRQHGLYVDAVVVGGQWVLRSPKDITSAQAEAELQRVDAAIALLDGRQVRVTPDGIAGIPIAPDLELSQQMLVQLASQLLAR